MTNDAASSSERRSFLGRLNAGAAALAAMAVGVVANGQVKPAAAAHWEPMHQDKDDWLDQGPGKHRLVFDTTNPEGLGLALLFTNNFLRVNRADYGLENSDLAIVIVVRHRSAPFGYSDAMWAKYGAAIASHVDFQDPKSHAASKINVYNSGEYLDLTPNRGTTLDSLARQGVRFAVCASATRVIAGEIARSTGGNIDTVFGELTANLIPNGRIVPAGIVAVNRAQERGYTLHARDRLTGCIRTCFARNL